MPPISRPTSTGGSKSEKFRSFAPLSDSSWMNAANSTSAASTAEPIA